MAKLKKLSEQDYFEIQTQYDKTPDISSSFGATGEHQMLRYMLHKLGYSVPSRRGGELEVADELLMMGYDHVESAY